MRTIGLALMVPLALFLGPACEKREAPAREQAPAATTGEPTAAPDLITAGSSSLEVQLDAEAHGTGEMRQGDQVLAAITGPFAFDVPLAFSWCP